MPDEAASASDASVLPVRFSHVGYSVSATAILKDVSIDVTPGGPTVLMGPNGSGKTTLLKLAMGLLQPVSGRITYAGAPGAPPGSRAIVFQKPVMLRRTVSANIAFALATANQPADDESVAALLEVAHMSALAERPARKLSGGEQQRLALARALARRPQILFLDEPTASLDPSSTKLVEDIIARVSASGVKIVMATHTIGQARRLGQDIVFLVDGRVVEHVPGTVFFASPASEQARRFLAGDLVV